MKKTILTLSLLLSTMFYGQSITELRQKANQGDVVVQNNLGLMYAKGEGVEQSYSEAVYWYRKAAEQGDAIAQTNLGGENGYDTGCDNLNKLKRRIGK